jgi:hypothetical protein
MQVSTANPARKYTQQYVASPRFRTGNLLDLEQAARRRMAGNKNGGFHGPPKPYPLWRRVLR